MNKRILLGACAMSAVTVFASTCCAATAGAADTSDTNQAASVTELVVTAEKREENLQKVPVAVTVFTSKQRDLAGIESIQDMTAFAPGLTYAGQSDHLYVRGVGRQSPDLAAPAGVATFIDGFYNPDPILVVLPPLFQQSTEVLRGPQGTLGGRNGIAGDLMLTSTRPTDTPYAELRTSYGNYGAADLEGAVSGPITNGLNFRLAAYDAEQQQGYFTNVAGGPSEGGVIHEWHIEGAITAKFGDNADLYVRTAVSDWNNGAGGPGSRTSNFQQPYSTFLNDDSSSFMFNGAAGYNPALILPGSLVQRNAGVAGNPGTANFYDFSGFDTAKVTLTGAYDVNGIFTYHFPSFDLKYTAGYSQYTYTTASDSGQEQNDVISYVVPQTTNLGFGTNPTCAPSANPFTSCLTVYPQTDIHYLQSDQWYSHELTAASTGNAPLQWIGGLYYYDENYTNPITIAAPRQTQVASPCVVTSIEGPGAGASAGCPAMLGLAAAPANSSQSLFYTNYAMESRSEAVYGQLDWKITPTIKLTGGLRYTSDQVSGTEYLRTVFFGGATLAGAIPLYANPNELGAATPAIDLTAFLCAKDNTSTNHQGETTSCTVNAAGIATRGLRDSSSAVTGTAGVEWTPDDKTLAYFRYSRGYKSVGFNAGYDLLGTGNASVAVAPEFMNDYELGLKKTWGNKLVVDATLFYEDYQNAQVPLRENVDGVVVNLLTSIPQTVSDGFELEANWFPVEHLAFALSYALDNTSVSSACQLPKSPTNCFLDSTNPGAGLQNIKGNELPNAPENKVALNGNYTFVFDPGKLILSATYEWRDRQFGSVFNNPWWIAPSSSNVDLRGIWQGNDDRYEFIVFVKNLFDTAQYGQGPQPTEAGNASTPGVYSQYVLQYRDPPRTFGVEFHYKFF